MVSNSSIFTYTLILLYRNPFSFWFWVLVLSWILWYYIRFTIIPILRPNDPKELPYLVPSQYLLITMDPLLKILTKAILAVLGKFETQLIA